MKKYTATLALALTLLLINSCNSKKEKLEGIWKLDVMEMNGTQLSGTSLGEWFWEFNEQGGYLVMVAGAKEKGRYQLKGDQLSMKSVTNEQKPETVYKITRLDSAVLNIESIGEKNHLQLFFIKTDKGETDEKD